MNQIVSTPMSFIRESSLENALKLLFGSVLANIYFIDTGAVSPVHSFKDSLHYFSIFSRFIGAFFFSTILSQLELNLRVIHTSLTMKSFDVPIIYRSPLITAIKKSGKRWIR